MIKGFVLVLAACCTVGHSCAAQLQQALRIGPGDTLQVNVYDTPDLNQSVVVDDAGTVKLSLLGQVPVGSLSTSQAARLIEQQLVASHMMRQPHVEVLITHAETQNVSVLGEVNHAGSVPITTPRPVLEVLSMAGGLTSLANRNITIQHRDRGDALVRYFVPNNMSAASPAEAAAEPMVQPGDTIVVPRAGVVYVMGDVARPGGIAMNSNSSTISLLQALALAGSTTHTAKANDARLIRKKDGGFENITVPVTDIAQGKKPDLPLHADDIVYVPFSYLRNVAVSAGAITASATSAVIYTIP